MPGMISMACVGNGRAIGALESRVVDSVLAAADHGSLRAAAPALGITRPGVEWLLFRP